MAIRDDELTAEELERQRALDHSWAAAQKALADPQFRVRLTDGIERVNRSNAAPLTRDEFLETTTPTTE